MMLILLTPLLLVSTVTGLGEWDKPWFCHDQDCPKYTVKEKTDTYERRQYEEGLWVSTTEKGFKYEEAMTKGFWKLFKYIGGDNEQKKSIAMTTPVRVSVKPGAGAFCTDDFTISFFIPYDMQSNAPKPSNEELFLEKSEEFEAFVTSYSGWNSEKSFTKAATDLFNELSDKDVSISDDMYYTVGYDSPWRLTNRHNEVWLIMKGKDKQMDIEATAGEILHKIIG